MLLKVLYTIFGICAAIALTGCICDFDFKGLFFNKNI
jgi:hypothetical protein